MTIKVSLAAMFILTAHQVLAADPVIKDHENRFEISLFAEAPQVANPIGVQVDDRGRVLVIESRTHFRPQKYDGPKTDRILLLEDTDGDNKADKTTIFQEGFIHAMDLARLDDGSLYVATRSAVHRLRDKDSDGRADEDVKVIDLQTKGDYPHNGLSGLAFDGKGGFYFGFGENLGAAYKLVGKDGVTLTGEGEGGGVYYCKLDGTKLRRVATGFWNPFGVCVDPAGNVFVTDNDPDSSPPCRLLHVIEGGDYGYQFQYGRSGLHIFQSWNGELPGTLPMVSGTGEAPCEILAYDGGLLVASWADNRLEHYTLKPRGASFETDQKFLVSGDLNFRPVGVGVAKDGTLYVSDWASASYELTDKGRIWRMRPKQPPKSLVVPSEDLLEPVYAAREMSLLHQLISADPFVRAAAIHRLSQLLSDDEAQRKAFQEALKVGIDTDYRGIAIALHRSTWDKRHSYIPEFLKNGDPEVRLITLKWIADERLSQFRGEVERSLNAGNLTRRLLAAHLAALERIEGKRIGDLPDPNLVLPILKNEQASPAVRALALQLLPANHPALSIEFLKSLVNQGDERLQSEAVRTLIAGSSVERRRLLAEIARDPKQRRNLRAEAIDGLAGDAAHKDQLLQFALGDNAMLRVSALRSLVEMPLSDPEKSRLSNLKSLPEAVRLFGEQEKKPPVDNIAAWQELIEGDGDPVHGRRVFFHSKVGYCSRCHRYDGRGNLIGPDLTRIHERRDPQWLLTTILHPSRDVAPAYRQWQIQMKDGRTMTGISLRKGSHSEDYLGADGKPFSVRLADVESRSEVETSMMPEGLPQTMTAKELRDVMAFLLAP